MKELWVMLGRNLLLVLIAITVIVIGYGILRSKPKPGVPETQSAAQYQLARGGPLTTSEQMFNFGNVSMAAGRVSHTYTVRNTGATPVTVTKLFTSCMCTDATLVTSKGRTGPFGMPGHAFIPVIAETIPSGETARVEVVFDPAAHGPAGVGRIDRVITLETDAHQPLELGFTAMVKP